DDHDDAVPRRQRPPQRGEAVRRLQRLAHRLTAVRRGRLVARPPQEVSDLELDSFPTVFHDAPHGDLLSPFYCKEPSEGRRTEVVRWGRRRETSTTPREHRTVERCLSAIAGPRGAVASRPCTNSSSTPPTWACACGPPTSTPCSPRPPAPCSPPSSSSPTPSPPPSAAPSPSPAATASTCCSTGSRSCCTASTRNTCCSTASRC